MHQVQEQPRKTGQPKTLERAHITGGESQSCPGRARQRLNRYNRVRMDETITLEFDGGSRGNPGPAGIGVVVRAKGGTPIVTLGRCIGRATSNVAEYTALITALQEARKLGAKKIVIRGDSELIIKQ